jgi:energy-coupling factor transporter ATP-binding protein EcfA2
VLILDEPTRALDPIASDEMIDLLLNRIYSDTRKTLLIATHRMDEALRLCNKVLVIDKGTHPGLRFDIGSETGPNYTSAVLPSGTGGGGAV